MSKYVYKEPNGTRYKLSIKKWNSKFSNRGRWPLFRAHLWVDGDTITIHFYYTILAKIVVTLIYPYMVLLAGYREANRDLYRTWYNKTTGSFSSDKCYRRQGGWTIIEELVGRKL